MKLYKIFSVAALALFVLACKKESPIEDIVGSSNGEHRASLRVTLNTRTPAVGDSIVLTASTWHVNDDINKVEFVRTVVEKYAVELELTNGAVSGWLDEKTPALLVVDSLYKDEVWRTVNKGDLVRYFETLSDSYVIRESYKEFEPADLADAELINAISDEAFTSLKDHLSKKINVADYKLLFPMAPATDISGSTLTAAGKMNLNQNLTRSLLISNALKSAAKKGDLFLTLKVKVTAQSSAGNEVVNVFQTKY